MTNTTQYDSEEIQRVQAKIDETAAQILAGGDFAARYRADPAGTLTLQGLPKEAVASLLEQARGENEVSGYMAPVWTWNGPPGSFNPDPINPGPFDPGPGPFDPGPNSGSIDF